MTTKLTTLTQTQRAATLAREAVARRVFRDAQWHRPTDAERAEYQAAVEAEMHAELAASRELLVRTDVAYPEDLPRVTKRVADLEALLGVAA